MSEEFELEQNPTQVEHEYGASEIQVLEGLEAVRKRPGMYIGSTSSSGLHHLVYEIVDNAIDEALAGFCTAIEVIIRDGNIITVVDNGRGVPVDIQQQTGKPALEVVYTILHAGGKFGGGGYKVSGGLHGVGASVVNALSEYLEVWVKRGGKTHYQRYERGKPTCKLQVVEENIVGTGTKTRYLPDKTVFETIESSFDIYSNRLRELAFLNKGIKITIKEEKTEKSHEFIYEGGIVSFVEDINKNKTP
ncbi:MAG: DNA topoisomerase IV subunit B, partial [Clostridia bacterium]|nr:DNA topoisomerase IV subunit B [Clostridia bacterium]